LLLVACQGLGAEATATRAYRGGEMTNVVRQLEDKVQKYFSGMDRRSRQLFWLSAFSAALVMASFSTRWTGPIFDFVSILIFGVLVALACLFAFPYANIWGSSEENKLNAYNSTRTMLITLITAAFTLSTLYYTYRSAEGSTKAAQDTQAVAEEVAESERQRQARAEIGQAVRLLSTKESVARTAGLYVLSELLDREGINTILAHRLVGLYVRTHAESPFASKDTWAAMAEENKRAAEDSPTIGIGSLSKRAADIQFALDVLSKHDKKLTDRGLYSPRVDLRDANLQGAALGHAKLAGVLFSGSHLDYMDTRTGAGPYADFRMADFQGATLFGAYLNNANLTGAKLNTPRNADGSTREDQRTVLQYTSFRRANLTQADLRASDLAKSDLRAATLKETNLAQASLAGARLEGADFTNAQLAGANLVNCDV
jgi:uncharacterized protein YjbI with pentapeptide repeats